MSSRRRQSMVESALSMLKSPSVIWDEAELLQEKETWPFIFPTAYGIIVTRSAIPIVSIFEDNAPRFAGSGSKAKAWRNCPPQWRLKLPILSPSKLPQSTKTSSGRGDSRSIGKYVCCASSGGDRAEKSSQ